MYHLLTRVRFGGTVTFVQDVNEWTRCTLAIGLAQFRNQFDVSWNALMAMSFLVTLPPLVVFFFAQRYFIRGISMTGIKG